MGVGVDLGLGIFRDGRRVEEVEEAVVLDLGRKYSYFETGTKDSIKAPPLPFGQFSDNNQNQQDYFCRGKKTKFDMIFITEFKGLFLEKKL